MSNDGNRVRLFGATGACFFACVLVIVMLVQGKSASAAELLVRDETWEFTEDEHGFHYFQLPMDAPGDLTSPDDYYLGEVHTHYEIMSQPSDEPFHLQVCIWADWNYPDHWTETCGHYTTLQGSGSQGDASSIPESWWNLHSDDPVDWSRPGDFYHLGIVIWRPDPREVISDWVSADAWAARELYLPLHLRATVVFVSAGATFSGWDYWLHGDNEAPEVSISSPSTGAEYPQGTVIEVLVEAADPDGEITLVELFDGQTKLGEDSSAPYQFSWSDPPVGEHVLAAVATDDGGRKTTSATVMIRVHDALGPVDATVSSDASIVSNEKKGEGCSCDARGRCRGSAAWTLIGILLLLLHRRRGRDKRTGRRKEPPASDLDLALF